MTNYFLNFISTTPSRHLATPKLREGAVGGTPLLSRRGICVGVSSRIQFFCSGFAFASFGFAVICFAGAQRNSIACPVKLRSNISRGHSVVIKWLLLLSFAFPARMTSSRTVILSGRLEPVQRINWNIFQLVGRTEVV